MRNFPAGDRPAGSTARQTGDDARAGVIRALAAVETGERNSLERLRGSLCAFVRSLRENGASRDDVIEVIRTIVSTPVTPSARFGLLHPARIALVELSVNWCVEEYESWRRTAGRSEESGRRNDPVEDRPPSDSG